jgi:hypothetical protein
MRKRIFALSVSVSVSVLNGCGSGGSSSEPGLGEANHVEPSPLVGVWRSVYQDDVTPLECVELTIYDEDYTWSRVSLNSVSSGFYIIDHVPTEDQRGEFSLTATSGNQLASCNQGIDIPVGSTATRFYDVRSDKELDFYLDQDVLAGPVSTLIKDLEATDALLANPNSDQLVAVSSTGYDVTKDASVNEALAALKQAQETNVASPPAKSPVSPKPTVPYPAIKQAQETNAASPPAKSPVSPKPTVPYPAITQQTTQAAGPEEIQIPAALTVVAEKPVYVEPAVETPPKYQQIVSVLPAVPALEPALPAEPDPEPVAPVFVSKIEDFSVTLQCNSCDVSEVRLSWESETTGLDKLEMYFEKGNTRLKVATLQADEHSSLKAINTTLDLMSEGGGCFEIVSIADDESTSVSPQRCFDLSS